MSIVILRKSAIIIICYSYFAPAILCTAGKSFVLTASLFIVAVWVRSNDCKLVLTNVELTLGWLVLGWAIVSGFEFRSRHLGIASITQVNSTGPSGLGKYKYQAGEKNRHQRFALAHFVLLGPARSSSGRDQPGKIKSSPDLLKDRLKIGMAGPVFRLI